MAGNEIKYVFSNELRSEKFLLLMRFSEKGHISGLFVIDQDNNLKQYELANGLSLKQEDKIHVSFSVDWLHSDKIASSTYFSGYIQQIDQNWDLLNIDWMLVYEDINSANNYSKNGKLLAGRNYESVYELPFPSFDLYIIS